MEACLVSECPTEKGGRPGRGDPIEHPGWLSGGASKAEWLLEGKTKDSEWQGERQVGAASPEGMDSRAGCWLLASWLLAQVPSQIWCYRDLLSYSFNKDILTSISAIWGSTLIASPERLSGLQALGSIWAPWPGPSPLEPCHSSFLLTPQPSSSSHLFLLCTMRMPGPASWQDREVPQGE